jgi:hypothetical protein
VSHRILTALLVSSHSETSVYVLLRAALLMGLPCTGIHRARLNMVHTFVVLPSGSSASREEWRMHEDLVEDLIRRCATDPSVQWAHVTFGDEDGSMPTVVDRIVHPVVGNGPPPVSP